MNETLPLRTSDSGPDRADYNEAYYLTEDAADELKKYRRCSTAGESEGALAEARRNHLTTAIVLLGRALELDKRTGDPRE